MITLESIPAGGEIFVAYGEHWFLSREEDMSTVPLPENFDIVDDFLKQFKKLRGKYQRSHNEDFTKDIWETISFVHSYETRNTNALPKTYKDLEKALVVGSAKSFERYSMHSLEWLAENGRCMDNIRPGNSTIEQAGRGAFASRFIPRGGLVAPGPLLHIANKTVLNLYETDLHTGERDIDRMYGKQLILNYCFGHRQSTLLLCPYTSPSAYINHNGDAPNAKVVWAKEGTPNFHHDWLNADIDDLKTIEVIGLSVDFVATRDIQPGEEYSLIMDQSGKKHGINILTNGVHHKTQRISLQEWNFRMIYHYHFEQWKNNNLILTPIMWYSSAIMSTTKVGRRAHGVGKRDGNMLLYILAKSQEGSLSETMMALYSTITMPSWLRHLR